MKGRPELRIGQLNRVFVRQNPDVTAPYGVKQGVTHPDQILLAQLDVERGHTSDWSMISV
jgi:hypothetical protein